MGLSFRIQVYPVISLHLTSGRPCAVTAEPSAAPPPFAPSQRPLRVGVGGGGASAVYHRWCGDRDGGLAARAGDSDWPGRAAAGAGAGRGRSRPLVWDPRLGVAK